MSTPSSTSTSLSSSNKRPPPSTSSSTPPPRPFKLLKLLFPQTPPHPPLITLHIHLLSSTLTLHLPPSTPISSLLSQIQQTSAISVQNISLSLANRPLDPSLSLSQSHIRSGALLLLLHHHHPLTHPSLSQSWQILQPLPRFLTSLFSHPLHLLDITHLFTPFLSLALETLTNGDPVWRHFDLFILSGVPAAIVKLYTSPAKRPLATQAVNLFIALGSSTNFMKLRVNAVPVVLEFCKLLLRTVGRKDELYVACRKELVAVLRLDGGGGLGCLRKGNVVEDLLPFVADLSDLILQGVVAGRDVAETSLVSDGCDLLGVVRRAMDGWEDGLRSDGFECWIGVLHNLFLGFLRFVEEGLREVKALSSVAMSNVLVGLRQCFEFTKICEEADSLLHKFLLDGRVSLNLLLRRAGRNVDLFWILKYKDVLDFETRKWFVLMMFPETKKDGDWYEMLIDRSQLMFHSFERINEAKVDDLQKNLFVAFENERANGPGVLREWLCLVCREIFDPKKVLFMSCPKDQRRFLPNSLSTVDPMHKVYYGFTGRLIALALMHNVQVGVTFDRVFFLQLAEKPVTLEDIQDADPCLYMSWRKILEMDVDILDSDDLGLTFVTEVEKFGSREIIELCQGGKQIIVNSSNREEYINLLVQHRFVKSISEQVSYFAKGFCDVISSANNVKLFFQSLDLKDFDKLLGGADSIISVMDWKVHTDYHGFKETDCTIRWFWEIVEGMSADEQRQLLLFWTSVRYLPFNGFRGLDAKLYVYKIVGSKDRLPTSRTCFYHLFLPDYKSKSLMKKRLLLISQEHVSCTFGFE